MGSTTLIYGAGNVGCEVLAALTARGVAPACFIDRRGDELGRVAGTRVLTLPEAAARFARSGASTDVVVAVHNRGAPVSQILDDLREAGFSRARSLFQFCRDESWLPELPYWLAPAFPWDESRDVIGNMRERLADNESRAVFDEQLSLRQSGDYRSLRRPKLSEQYMPPDIPRWKTPLRLIDCGAYDGDTIRTLHEHGYPIEDAVAFEPHDDNFKRLESWLQSFGRGRGICAGVSNRRGVLSFSGSGTATRVDASGSHSIRVETIDEACDGFAPNLVKMDIEGSESDALDGAAATIAKWRPGLAIGIYHRPEDFFGIQAKIDGFNLGYRFYLRSHAFNGFETVLYAIAAS